ncbi:MAG: gamma carbonic anhydrase family protein [Pirellulaceae bacterium]|nr:gamma carbonic anhydrase family protein [Pirellulaceae bacterium]
MFDPFAFHPELVDSAAFLASGARLIGNVIIGAESSVWFNAVIRGDREAIRLGRQTNVQDLCVLHADPGRPCTLGDRVSVGHAAIVHGATVDDDVLIGMRAVVMNRARVPGKITRAAEERDRQRIRHAAEYYVKLGKQYAAKGEE